MEEELRKRLQYILSIKGYSINKLASGVTNLSVKLNNQINKSTTISAETIGLVLEKFPDISAEWLIRGEGDPHKDSEDTIINNAHTHNGHANAGGTQTINEASTQLLMEKDARIVLLEARIIELQKDKDFLMGIITNKK